MMLLILKDSPAICCNLFVGRALHAGFIEASIITQAFDRLGLIPTKRISATVGFKMEKPVLAAKNKLPKAAAKPILPLPCLVLR